MPLAITTVSASRVSSSESTGGAQLTPSRSQCCASAATRARLSTASSVSARKPCLMPWASSGSTSRAAVVTVTGWPWAASHAATVFRSSTSARSTATTSDSRAVTTSGGRPSRNDPSFHSASDASPICSSRSSPGQPSLCGASMPPATHDAPRSSVLCTRTDQPSSAARRATDKPMTPPPTTASERPLGPDDISAPFAGMTRIRCDGKGWCRCPLSVPGPGTPV